MKKKMIIKIGKVKENFGWMGNMGKRKLIYNGKRWESSEGLFISMRFNDEDIIEELRKEDNGGMRVKMISKKYYDKMVVERCSEKDVENMRKVVKLKYDSYEFMRKGLSKLNEMYDLFIYEDVSNRKRGNNLFWGGYFEGDEFYGENMLGKIWMDLVKK
jgi:predicted NAD-dependent protein-ADP-ribosyltransferase YbiA (DUF1768 family)